METARWSLAEKQADDLTKNLVAPPVPVIEIAEQSGVDVVFANFGEHTSTVAGFCDFAESKLFVNRDDATERQTFTIAHELGHWLLHRDKFLADPENYSVLPRFSEPVKNPVEQEANHFAANLLVPKRFLVPVITVPTARLAAIFGVSRLMMDFRVNNVLRNA
jgi:Zn-dependent peptidase ImmA (M78 family)